MIVAALMLQQHEEAAWTDSAMTVFVQIFMPDGFAFGPVLL